MSTSQKKSAQPAGTLVEIVPGISVRGVHVSVPFTSIQGWEHLSGGSNSKNQATDLLPITQVICYKSESEKYYPLVKRDLLMPELREAGSGYTHIVEKYYPLVKRDLLMPELREAGSGYTHIVVFVITNFRRLAVSKQQQIRAYLQFIAPARGLFGARKIIEYITGSDALRQYFTELGITDPLSRRNLFLLCCGTASSSTIARMRQEFGVVDSERTARGRAAYAKKNTNNIVDCIPPSRGIQGNRQRELTFK